MADDLNQGNAQAGMPGAANTDMAGSAQGSAPPTEIPAVARLYSELQREKAALSRMRFVSSMTLLAIFAVYMFFFAMRIRNFDKNKFGSALQEKAVALLPEIQDRASAVAKEQFPRAKREVRKVIRARLPRIKMALTNEYKETRKQMFDRVRQRLVSELSRKLENHSKRLLKEYPELANDEQRAAILMRMKQIAKRVVQRVVAKDIADIRRNLDSIEITLGRSDIREEIKALKQDPKLRSKTIGYLMAVVARPLYEGPPKRYMGDVSSSGKDTSK